MKINRTEFLIRKGKFVDSNEFNQVLQEVYQAINAVCWPPGNDQFILYPEKKGNGVKPIKEGFINALYNYNWQIEERMSIVANTRPGPVDALKILSNHKPFVVEWETGNISSSHRALNKIATVLIDEVIIGGILIIPSRKLYNWLTDRIGNFPEIEPYFPLWRSITVKQGVLAVIEVEHDGTSESVPRILKGTDGRALR
ncbi:restriction endonuclease [Crocosphaera sp. UHCC 0190]|uniref:restriction endonuclease n=1 Tax=Crocosphaera sp. UHCC 0190 TaxID=3110246 RepID=UPI002B1F814B|nr:restriction endonuclease [Crocosphaera sp. UHCC 0190]MEA5512097.1 restriction endonuclease [Crocosphaera sp. UHCC 0190]